LPERFQAFGDRTRFASINFAAFPAFPARMAAIDPQNLFLMNYEGSVNGMIKKASFPLTFENQLPIAFYILNFNQWLYPCQAKIDQIRGRLIPNAGKRKGSSRSCSQ
jgi:hypothetical protein